MRPTTNTLLGGALALGLIRAAFTPTSADEADARVLVSTRPARQEAVALDGRAFPANENVYIFADVNKDLSVRRVDFYVDGGRWRRDPAAPYDLLGNSNDGAKGLNTRDLGEGVHTIRAVVVTRRDQIQSTATFRVGGTITAPTTTAPAPTTTTTAPTTTAPAPTTTTTTPVPAQRDVFLWPFSSTSPWNTPIGSGARYSSSGAAITQNLLDPTVTPWVNAAEYSHPVVRATSSDPMVQVNWRYASVSPWTNGSTSYRIPAAAKLAQGADAHLHVVDPDGRTLHEAFAMAGTGSSRSAMKYARFDLHGSGVGTVNGVNAGTRAYGGSAIGGLIRSWELDAGVIRHSLALALKNGQLRSGYVWPATSQDTGGSAYAGEVPMGSLVAIPPEVNVDALGLTSSGRILARALQDYGAYVVDRGGAFALYAEPSAEPLVKDIRRDLAEIRRHLRVVENNGPSSVGGGGTPRQPFAPAL